MARTIKYSEILDAIRIHLPRNIGDDHSPRICNLATSEIWKKYDFRETLTTLPPFYLVPNEQDYGAPTVTIPSDFLGLRKVNLVALTSIPPVRRELKVIKDLQLTSVRYYPLHAICYNPETNSLRVFPRVPENVGSPDYIIDGSYKKRPTKIVNSTLETVIPLDDIHEKMFIEGMKWAAFEIAGDPRAGEAQVQSGMTSYSGQLAKFHREMDLSAQMEGLELGDPAISPSEPLGFRYGNNNFSIYGNIF